MQVITKYAFRMASIWLLTMASVVKCCVIVKPMTYWTVFTDRLLNIAISLIWICCIVLTTSWLLGPTDPRPLWWVPLPRCDNNTTFSCRDHPPIRSHRSTCGVELQLGASHVDGLRREAKCAADEGDCGVLRSRLHRARCLRPDFRHSPSPSTCRRPVATSPHHDWAMVPHHERTVVLQHAYKRLF